METISIIVPVYNVFPYLRKCVKSLTDQTYKRIEIILVDDGSADGSGELCDRLAKEDERIRVIHQKNAGLSEARNTGIEFAEGDYLCFVDSDDWVAQSYCERLYRALKKGNAGIALCDFVRVADESAVMGEKGETSFFSASEITGWLADWRSEKYARAVVAWNKLYARDCFRNVRYPSGKLHEDEFVIHLLLDTQKNVAVVSEALYYYRQRADSIMGKCDHKSNPHYLDKLEALEGRIRFYENRNRRAFLDAFHNNMRAANSYYEIYRKLPGETYQRKSKQIWRRYRELFHEYRRSFEMKELIQLGLFAWMPQVYSLLCAIKYRMWEDGKNYGAVENRD